MTYLSIQPHPDGLSPEQLDALRSLADTLSPGQSLLAAQWLLGRLDPAALAQDRLVSLASADAPQSAGLTILYGSHSGHSAAIAKAFAKRAQERGWQVTLANMADYSRSNLKRERNLAVIVSTHGDGDPPESIVPFFEFLSGPRAPKLSDCQYAVLALGDKSYLHFCKTGLTFDSRLEHLGARRLLERVDLDVDYQDGADAWTAKALDAFAPHMVPAKSAPRLSIARSPRRFDRENPWNAELLEQVVLSGRGSTQRYLHLELSLENSNIKYEPGDALGVRPVNDPALVEQIVQALAAKGDEPIAVAGDDLNLRDALTHRLEIQRVTPSSLRKYAALGARSLADVVQSEDQTTSYVAGRDWLDVLREHPTAISAKDFALLLPELSSRSYSIASSLEAHPDEVHLLVSRLEYVAHGRTRAGVASSFLADRVHPGDKLSVWVEPNSSFRLPSNPDLPIIMIGAGTGIAPFRAFMEARAAAGSKGKNWIVFGNRNFRSDFTYQIEWLKWREQGLLHRMDVAFSRDRAEKIYVSDKLCEAGRELYAWLEQGAHVYLCGDRAKLSASIDRALAQVVAKHGNKTPEQAASYVEQLQVDRRYLKDVY